MSKGVISVNVRKIKRDVQLSQLRKEMVRDETTAHQYDDGVRNIDVSRTKNNVILQDVEDIETYRKKRLERASEVRKSTGMRKIRKDAVDCISAVIQYEKDFLKGKSYDEIVDLYTHAYEHLKDSKQIGDVSICVIHFDETTPHMQVITSAIDTDSGLCNAKRILGNKRDLSKLQDDFAEGVNQRVEGYEIVRGTNRMTKNYQDRKEEIERATMQKVDRHNQALLEQSIIDLNDNIKGANDVFDELRDPMIQMLEDDINNGRNTSLINDVFGANHERTLKSLKRGNKRNRNKLVQYFQRSFKQNKDDYDERNKAINKREERLRQREGEVTQRERNVDKRERIVQKTDEELKAIIDREVQTRLMLRNTDKETPNKRMMDKMRQLDYIKQRHPETFQESFKAVNKNDKDIQLD